MNRVSFCQNYGAKLCLGWSYYFSINTSIAQQTLCSTYYLNFCRILSKRTLKLVLYLTLAALTRAGFSKTTL